MNTPTLLSIGGGLAVACALAATAVLLPAAQAEPEGGAHAQASCFYITQLGPMRPDGARAIYSRISGRTVVRFNIAPDCNSLPGNAEGITVRAVNSGSICSGLDLDISVRDTHERCIVRSIDRLSPDEAAALPKSLQP
ncbi:MAG: hypothetical protein ACHP84_05030 [Caulobacterales bacterium]